MASKIEKFEDFIAWQKARNLTREIYKIMNLPAFSRDFGLKDQIRRSAVSIMSNIAEGFERGRASEFHQFLSNLASINSCSLRLKSDKSSAGSAYRSKDERPCISFL